MIQNMLCIQLPISLPELAMKFGCMCVLQSTQRTLTEFQSRFRETLNCDQKLHLNFRNPAYPAAALYLVAIKAKLRVDKALLVKDVNCEVESFEAICSQFLEYFPSLKPAEVVQREKRTHTAPKTTYVQVVSETPKDTSCPKPPPPHPSHPKHRVLFGLRW
eukprot:NODE_1594_length_1120_cov_35.116713_g1299_i0.p1 GENE.NODE_1594_length_1120_cov_35.116713_g1299_i0~~NODE_1594_length_1120_cov_35.116713_g1299_i0.p1  ORF type:complete len:161 (-),score=33.02 NODE_1594_length_1120_cov_35.116713_g1299_i0:545-1027(-)